MEKTRLTSSAGFTFVAAMFLVVIMGIMLEAASQSWRTIMHREREAELLFRGNQIRSAIERWRKPSPGRQVMPINDLKDLLEDPHSQQKVRYLRKIYKDPITNEDFTVIRDPALGVIGVASTSDLEPFKVDNFPKELQDFTLKKRYSDWKFVYKPAAPTAPTTTVTTTNPMNQPVPPVPPPPPNQQPAE